MSLIENAGHDKLRAFKNLNFEKLTVVSILRKLDVGYSLADGHDLKCYGHCLLLLLIVMGWFISLCFNVKNSVNMSIELMSVHFRKTPRDLDRHFCQI